MKNACQKTIFNNQPVSKCLWDALYLLWWGKGLLQELLNLVCVCSDLLVVEEEGRLGPRSQILQHIRCPARSDHAQC